jgi:MoaA/NifB/PqqE/SkfB family radical SAM enzyme
MNSVKKMVSTLLINEGLNYIDKDPVGNFPKLLNWADKIATRPDHKDAVKLFRKIMADPDNVWNKYINMVLTELHPNVLKKLLINYFVNSGMVGEPLKDELAKKNDCSIPWAILMDPTSACNLKCTGCWAAEYNKTDSMSYEVLDRIITEGKELGIYMYIYSGGEPMVRKADILKLCEKHSDCMFLTFTNATLIDEEFAKEAQKAGNLLFAISVEGSREETDFRRGEGTYDKVMKGMDILKKYGLGFGFSSCYTRKNVETIGSDAYTDFMIEKGCKFGWYFTYIPIGKDAVMDLVATPEQREYMYRRVRKMRTEKPIFLMDFWNDGEYVQGCIAGTKNYIHINSNGDVEPCAFIHYSNVNIKNTSLLEALKSPIFREYRKHQPFNKNHLRPCPLLDNPQMLKEMVHNSNAHSTQPIDKEEVDDLTAKCMPIAEKWAPVADKLWKESHPEDK